MSWYSPHPSDEEDFSLVLGGPLYQLWLRFRMMRPPLDLMHRRLTGLTMFRLEDLLDRIMKLFL